MAWLHLYKENPTKPHWNLHPLFYGPYTIPKDVDENDFELSILPLLSLHPIFNMYLLQQYFPPLSNITEVEK